MAFSRTARQLAVAAFLCLGLGVDGPAAAGGLPLQEETEPGFRLVGAELEVTAESPIAARIRAQYEVMGDGNLALMLVWFPGQTLSEVLVEVNGSAIPIDFGPVAVGAGAGDGVRLAGLQLAGSGPHGVSVIYRVESDAPFAYRFPLIVPHAVPDSGARSVDLSVHLPAGASFTGDSFPNLVTSGDMQLRARMAAVPAFAHVVFADAPGLIGVALRLELVAIMIVLLSVAVVVARWWRREGAT